MTKLMELYMNKRLAFVLTTTLIVSACSGTSKNSDEVTKQQDNATKTAVHHYLCESGGPKQPSLALKECFCIISKKVALEILLNAVAKLKYTW
jgi:ABC-type enterochelin transport system substrate-binding protein